jgi:hypothetical protein
MHKLDSVGFGGAMVGEVCYSGWIEGAMGRNLYRGQVVTGMLMRWTPSLQALGWFIAVPARISEESTGCSLGPLFF